MPQIKMKDIDQYRHKTLSDALDEYMRRCRLKNLSIRTQEYYKENFAHFRKIMPQIKYVDELTREQMEAFILKEMERGNKVTAINARLRGMYAFIRFCFEQDYLESYPLSLLKEDETIKKPYTDEELQRLLRQPKEDKWIEWRTWAAINTLVATGIRASTLVSMKICDVDFEQNCIRLRKLKNRKQQIIPLSSSLKAVLELYLKTWEWEADNYLFPNHQQLRTPSMTRAIAVYNVQRGVTKTSTHLFRHTFAKNYILAGGGRRVCGRTRQPACRPTHHSARHVPGQVFFHASDGVFAALHSGYSSSVRVWDGMPVLSGPDFPRRIHDTTTRRADSSLPGAVWVIFTFTSRPGVVE